MNYSLGYKNSAPIFERKTTKDKPLRGETTIEDVYGKLETQHGFEEREREKAYIALTDKKLILSDETPDTDGEKKKKKEDRISLGKGITISLDDLKTRLKIDDEEDDDDE